MCFRRRPASTASPLKFLQRSVCEARAFWKARRAVVSRISDRTEDGLGLAPVKKYPTLGLLEKRSRVLLALLISRINDCPISRVATPWVRLPVEPGPTLWSSRLRPAELTVRTFVRTFVGSHAKRRTASRVSHPRFHGLAVNRRVVGSSPPEEPIFSLSYGTRI